MRRVSGRSAGSILDIGAGTGEFLAVMRRGGWQVTGLEPSDRGRRYALDQLQLRMEDLSALGSLPDRSFDVVTLWHVLEHVHDVGGTLGEISRLLKEDGVCIIAVPNCACPDADHYREHWAALDVPRHLSHFTPATVEAWAARAGFAMTKMRSALLDAVYICVLSEQYAQGSALRGLWHGTWSAWRGILHPELGGTIVCVLAKAPISP